MKTCGQRIRKRKRNKRKDIKKKEKVYRRQEITLDQRDERKDRFLSNVQMIFPLGPKNLSNPRKLEI